MAASAWRPISSRDAVGPTDDDDPKKNARQGEPWRAVSSQPKPPDANPKGTTGDDPSIEWEDEASTDVVTPGAFPDLEAEDETTPRRVLCLDCQSPSMPGGALSTTPAEWERVAKSEACLRGERWDYCARRGRLSLWLKRAD